MDRWSQLEAKTRLFMLGLLLALPGRGSAEEPDRRPPLVFSGNVVLIDEVYLTVLELPPGFVADKSGAELVRTQLLSFLRRAGYELARVETAAEGDHIIVDIDEGRVEKIVLRGQSSLRTVQLLFSLSLPQNIFNRPYLERQLAKMRAETGVEVEHYELVRTAEVKHVGPQVEDLGPIVNELGQFVGHPLIPPQADYELQIVFRQREWSTGLGLVAALSGVDGLRLGLQYRGVDLWRPRDRWSASAQVGTKVRSNIADGHAYPALTRALAELQWYTPPLGSGTRLGLRPLLAARGDLTSRQRPDIQLESYFATRVQLTLGLSYDISPGASVTIGVGGEELDVLSLSPVQGMSPAGGVAKSSTLKPYLSGGALFVFDSEDIRRDRHHELELTGRHYPGNADHGYGLTTYRYQHVSELGWHDLWFTSKGAWIWGKAPFIEEQPVGGEYLRGVFGDRFYARQVVSGSLEARFSLTRDVYKVGGFADVAVFGLLDRNGGSASPQVVTSAGPSFHVLIADAFQLDLYYAIGFTAQGKVDRGFSASLKQAF